MTGNVALAAASTNLALRAIALWCTVGAPSAQAPSDLTTARTRRWRKATVIVWILRSLCICHVVFGFVVGMAGPKISWQATSITHSSSQTSAATSAVAPEYSSDDTAPPVAIGGYSSDDDATSVTTGIGGETCVIDMDGARGALFAFYVFSASLIRLVIWLTN